MHISTTAMHISTTAIGAVLLVAVASLALAAGQVSDEPEQDGAFAYDNLGNAFYAKSEAAIESEAAIAYTFAGDIKRVRLDPKDPDAHHDRATEEQSDLNQVIIFYSAAIRRDPQDDDAYFHRGVANFYAGALPQALADVSQANKLDPEYAYYALWIDILEKRGNLASHHLPLAISQIDMAKWPAPVISLFLGRTTPTAMLAAANDSDTSTKRARLCEANFYLGEFALQQGTKKEATRLFRLAAADCPHDFVEGPAAGAELGVLGNNP